MAERIEVLIGVETLGSKEHRTSWGFPGKSQELSLTASKVRVTSIARNSPDTQPLLNTFVAGETTGLVRRAMRSDVFDVVK